MQLEYMVYVTYNENAIMNSSECACIYCYKKFEPKEIIDFWYDIKELTNGTAICPNCSVDSIVPNSLIKYDDQLLKKWHKIGWN
ncbi:Hypothetical protein KVN_LOCUS271 [uncultured virus]|nr:Hypothetical protein KVN_LOCUS271 [uncultured virus]